MKNSITIVPFEMDALEEKTDEWLWKMFYLQALILSG
jgi:hypothetical protein